MIRSFIKDSIIYTLPVILSRGIGIFLLPIYTRIISPDELGALELFIAFGNIIALTVALEITQGIARFIPESQGKLRGSFAFTGLVFTLITYSVSILIFFLFADVLSIFITGSEDYFSEFKLALIYIFFNGFYYYFQNLLRFEGKSLLFSISSVAYALSNLILVVVFGIILDQGLDAILNSLILSNFFVSVLSLIFLRNSFVKVFRFDLLKKLLAFSLPLVPSSVLVFVSLYIDRYMINYFLGLDNVGIYSVGIKLASATALLMVGFQMAITPLVYKHYKKPETRDSLSLIFRYFVILSLVFFTTFSLFSNEVVVLLTDPDFHKAQIVIPSLVLAFLFSHMYVFLPGITIKKKTHIILFINLVAAIFNIFLNILLIPVLGILGAAFATTFGYFIGFLLYIFYSQKLYYVTHNWKKYILNFLLALIIVTSYKIFLPFNEAYVDIVFRIILLFVLILSILFSKLVLKKELGTIRNLILSKKN